MPALSSSPIHPVLGHLANLAGDAAGDSPGLLAVLTTSADPRDLRGVRHRLAVILGLAVCAVLAGARSSPRSPNGLLTPMNRPWPGWESAVRCPWRSTFQRTL
jgi:DDE_Tnp_1-associated